MCSFSCCYSFVWCHCPAHTHTHATACWMQKSLFWRFQNVIGILVFDMGRIERPVGCSQFVCAYAVFLFFFFFSLHHRNQKRIHKANTEKNECFLCISIWNWNRIVCGRSPFWLNRHIFSSIKRSKKNRKRENHFFLGVLKWNSKINEIAISMLYSLSRHLYISAFCCITSAFFRSFYSFFASAFNIPVRFIVHTYRKSAKAFQSRRTQRHQQQ